MDGSPQLGPAGRCVGQSPQKLKQILNYRANVNINGGMCDLYMAQPHSFHSQGGSFRM